MDNNISQNNTEQRNKLAKKKIAIVVALLFGLSAGVYVAVSPNSNNGNGSVNAASVQTESGIPTESTDPNYQKELAAHNAQAASEAWQNGGSYIPTPINTEASKPVDSKEFEQGLDDSATASPSMVAASDVQVQPAVVPTPVQTTPQFSTAAPVTEIYVNNVTKEIPVEVSEPYDYKKDFSLFSFFNTQKTTPEAGKYVATRLSKTDSTKEDTTAQNQNTASQQESAQQETANNKVAIYKIGDLIPATLQTGIDTRLPSIIRARIESGPLAGAILTGSFSQTGKSVQVQFNNLNIPHASQSIPIEGFAMNYQDASTALRTSVNQYIPERIAATLIQTFANSYAEQLSENNRTTSTTTITNTQTGNTSQLYNEGTRPKTTREMMKEAAAAGIGEATGILGSLVPNQPTVKVKANHEIAVYVSADWFIDKKFLEK